MKLHRHNWTLNLTTALALVWAAQGADTLRYLAQPQGSKVTMDGTSTIHDWTVEGKIIGGFFEAAAAWDTDKSLKSAMTPAPKAEITIPIRTLKSGKERMDEIMQEAMKAKDFPLIKFKLSEMKLKGDVPASGTPAKFDTKGDLTVSGVTKPCEMEVTMERTDDGKLKFSATKPLKMTDFGIQPPNPNIGGVGIKTGDEIIIKFDWMVAPKKA
jgi:polyisoprenoid-binding protein YceI